MAIVTHPLATGRPPSWASEWGRDEFGVFTAFEVRGVVQRMRWIPPGEYRVGSPEDEPGRWPDEALRTVLLTHGYWIADTPCTQAMWRAVLGTEPSHFFGDERPVEWVSWEDVQEFLERLNLEPSQEVFRLPTDAEWEVACRAGGREEFLPETLDEVAWTSENSGGESHPVARKQPNAAGLYDTLGNIAEWTLDSCERPGFEELQAEWGRVDPISNRGAQRVLRGGSWFFEARVARAAARYAYAPADRRTYLGFRLARGPAVRATQGVASHGAERAVDAEPDSSRE